MFPRKRFVQLKPRFGAVTPSGAIDPLREAVLALQEANFKFQNQTARQFVSDMIGVTQQLIQWIPTQGGQ